MIQNDIQKQLKRYERQLKKVNARAMPFAIRAELNRAAFETRKRGISNIEQDMTLRNKWTVKSVRVIKAKGLRINQMQSEVGSTEEYMHTQEFGGTKTKTGKRGVAIPTGYSAGQRGQQPRTRLPRGKNKLRAIQLAKRKIRAKNRQQRNIIAIKQAQKSGNKYVYLDLGRREGLFKVTGGKRNARIRMVHDLSRRSVRVPATPWLTPATNSTLPHRPGYYRDALRFQLRRLGVRV